jgi:hypothetical protein
MTEETKLIWKDWNEEDWINASYCDTCGLPLIMLEPEEGETCGEMACVYCTWEEDQTSIFEGKLAELQSAINEQSSEILRLRELLKEVANNSMDLVCEYSDDPHKHTSGCPKGVIGIHQNKPGDCICGYEAKFAKHTTLMEKLKQEGIEVVG